VRCIYIKQSQPSYSTKICPLQMLARSFALPTGGHVLDCSMPQLFNSSNMMMPGNDAVKSLLDAFLCQRGLPIAMNQPHVMGRQPQAPDCSFAGPSLSSSISLTSQLIAEVQQRYAITAAALARQSSSQLNTLPPLLSTAMLPEFIPQQATQNFIYGSPLSAAVEDRSFNLPHSLMNACSTSGKRTRDTFEHISSCEQNLHPFTRIDSTSSSASHATTAELRTPSASSAISEQSSKKPRRSNSAGSLTCSDDADDQDLSGTEEERRSGSSGKRSATIRWTRTEHEQFLEGLERFGIGQWCSIARHCVPTRSPAQVASHHQKFAIRSNMPPERRHKASLLDITTPKVQSLVAAQGTAEA
jgi:SHAQKYF class myb-like DNA-binding protein